MEQMKAGELLKWIFVTLGGFRMMTSFVFGENVFVDEWS